MKDYYVEVVIKRDVTQEKKKRQKNMLIAMAVMLILGIIMASRIYYFLFLLCLLGYYFFAWNYSVEFEYFYMDGELTISKIINMSRRKKILELSDSMIKVIAPIGSAALQEFHSLNYIDCTENDSMTVPYVIVCDYKGKTKAVSIQMKDELYREIKRNIPNKLKKY